MDAPVAKIPKAKFDILLNGTREETYSYRGEMVTFPGILAQLEQKYRETDSEYVRAELEGYMRRMLCPSCQGKRLQPAVLAITIAGKSIADVVNMPVEDVKEFFGKVSKMEPIFAEASAGRKV